MTKVRISRRELLQWGGGLAVARLHGFSPSPAPSHGTPFMGFSLQLIRNATVKLHIGQSTLLVDPYLADQHAGRSYAGTVRSPLVPLPICLEDVLKGVDAVFVSHLHSDHFDEAARTVLPKSIPILCPESIAPGIRAAGFQSVREISDRVAWCGLTLHLTEGRHGPDSVLEDMGEVHGFVLTGRGFPTFYWAGDSIWCPEVQSVMDHHAPAITVVHACGATWKGRGPLVMDETQVEALMRHRASGKVIATHMDCVDHATVSRADLARHMSKFPELRSRLMIPVDGERVQLTTKAGSRSVPSVG